jgi:hypothetical protein
LENSRLSGGFPEIIKGKTHSRLTAGVRVRYRTSACKDCALQRQCTCYRTGRTITREQDETVMEAMAARVAAHPEKLKLRKLLCEHPFGTIKRFLGYSYFLMKGLVKVRGEWSLITLAYNLKHVLNLVSFGKLMQAVGGQSPATRLKSGGDALFSFFDPSLHPNRCPHRFPSRKLKTGDPYFRTTGPSLFCSLRQTFYTASRGVSKPTPPGGGQ